MKKVLAIAFVGTFALASCSKEYTCECTTDVNGSETSTTTTGEFKKKSDAEDWCSSSSDNTTCELQ